MPSSWWTPPVHAVLGSVVVTIGFWLMWGALSLTWTVAFALAVAGFLTWQATTITSVWAWSTLLLGLDSLAWPIVTMVQTRLAAEQPNDEQMGTILTAVLFGLFSSVFWISFAFGLFKRVRRQTTFQPSGMGGPVDDSRGSREAKGATRR